LIASMDLVEGHFPWIVFPLQNVASVFAFY
jgi:hypothetical protein